MPSLRVHILLLVLLAGCECALFPPIPEPTELPPPARAERPSVTPSRASKEASPLAELLPASAEGWTRGGEQRRRRERPNRSSSTWVRTVDGKEQRVNVRLLSEETAEKARTRFDTLLARAKEREGLVPAPEEEFGPGAWIVSSQGKRAEQLVYVEGRVIVAVRPAADAAWFAKRIRERIQRSKRYGSLPSLEGVSSTTE